MGRYKLPYSLYKRGNYWYYKTYRPDGTRTAGKTTGCTAKGLAVKYCNQLYLLGALYHSDILFKTYAENFYAADGLYFSDSLKPYSPNTIANYQKQLKNVILPYFKDIKIGDLSYTKLKEFRIFLISNYAPKTADTTLNILKHIIDTAYKDRVINDNPFRFLESVPIPRNRRDAFTLEEVKTLFTQIEEEFKYAILVMALTGMRMSEYIGALDNQLIHSVSNGIEFDYIDLKVQKNMNKIMPVKSDSCRQIPIIAEIKDILINNPFVPERTSAFYRYYNKIKNQFDRALERNLCFHSLRHFFITNAKSENVPDIKVEYIAGHKLTGIQNIYTNFKAEDVIEILEWQKKTYEYITK